MEERLILGNDIVLEGSSCGSDSEYSVWCFLRGVSFSEAFQYFSNPENWTKVVYEIITSVNIRRFTYTGMTELSAIQQARDSVDVRLKGYDIQIKEEDIPANPDEGDSDDTVHDDN